jgi:hypothetical protein
MSYDNLSNVSQNVLKFYYQLTGEEGRIPVLFDDFHFCRSRVIPLDMTENRIFILCRMITWVVFLGIFWYFISSLQMKKGGSLSYLTIFTFAVPELFDLIWRKIWFIPYVITQVIIRHRVNILFSVISSLITLERQKWKSSKIKGSSSLHQYTADNILNDSKKHNSSYRTT